MGTVKSSRCHDVTLAGNLTKRKRKEKKRGIDKKEKLQSSIVSTPKYTSNNMDLTKGERFVDHPPVSTRFILSMTSHNTGFHPSDARSNAPNLLSRVFAFTAHERTHHPLNQSWKWKRNNTSTRIDAEKVSSKNQLI